MVCGAMAARAAERRVGIVVLSRMGSRRLPGKALAPLAGRPLLGWVLARLQRCARADCQVVATSDLPRDDAIVDYCRSMSVPVFRGSETDVLGRLRMTADAFHLSDVVRISGDSPLLDPRLVDEAIARHLETAAELTTNAYPRTVPNGMSVEVLSHSLLSRMDDCVADADDREHVTPWAYRAENGVAVQGIGAAGGYDPDNRRLVVDTSDDLQFIGTLLTKFGSRALVASLAEIQTAVNYLESTTRGA